MTSLREETKLELKKLKEMSWKDRIWYIWEYYKFHMLGLFMAFLALSTVGTVLYNQTFTTRLAIAVVNDQKGGSLSPIEPELREALGCTKKDLVELNEGLHVDFEGGSSSQYDYASLAKLSALTASQSLDVLIGDQSAIFQYAAASAYEPLTQLLTNDMYERLKDYILMAPDETGTPQPVALSLKSTEFTAKTGIDMDPPYLAVMASSPRKEAALQMISYLFPETP